MRKRGHDAPLGTTSFAIAERKTYLLRRERPAHASILRMSMDIRGECGTKPCELQYTNAQSAIRTVRRFSEFGELRIRCGKLQFHS